MIIKKSVAVAFLLNIGFPKAPEWEDEKIVSTLEKVPGRVDQSDVSENFKSFFEELCAARDEPVELKIDGETEQELSEGKRAKKGAKKKVTEESDAPVKAPKAKKGKKVPAKKEKPVKAEKKVKEPKKEKAVKAPKVKKEKQARADTDSFGAKMGTIRSKVNAAISKKWQTKAEIASTAGVTPVQAGVRLEAGTELGAFEKRKGEEGVQFKLA